MGKYFGTDGFRGKAGVDLTAEHAFQEGEGDRTLASWRAVHEAFFTGEMERAGLTFTKEMPVVCEEFEVAYRP